MRFLTVLVLIAVAQISHAQSFFPATLSYHRFMNPATPFAQLDSTTAVKKKWSLQTYSSLSAGLMMWKGGSASYLSVPVGVQLNRRISDNVFAFAGISAAPSVVNFRQSFLNSNFKNGGSQGMYQPYQFGMYSRAELGIGYTNDAHTFQITGSIGIERSDYPFAQRMQPIGSNRNQPIFIK